MMKTHIAIATTNGLVMVQQLTEEDDDVMSLVCLGLTSKQLSVSAAYADFVKKGSGLIAKEFGHGAWRLDISANIDSGDSWQLPVYLAHHFYAKDELGNGDPQPGDVVLIATGALSVTRDIKPVEHIPAKQRASLATIEAWQDAGITCRWVVHADNAVELNTELDVTIVAALDDLSTSDDGSDETAEPSAPSSPSSPSAQPDSAPEHLSSTDPHSVKIPLIKAIGAIVLLSAAWFFWSPADTGRSLDDFGGSAKTLSDDPLGVVDSWKDELPQIVVTQNDDPFLCGQSGDEKKVHELRMGNYFPAVALEDTCHILLKTESNIQKVWLVSLDTGAIVELTYAGEWRGWRIPMPENQRDDRPYGLLMFSEIDPAEMKGLRARLLESEWSSARDVQNALVGVTGEDARVVFHKLKAAG
jgi:hypothetical protein